MRLLTLSFFTLLCYTNFTFSQDRFEPNNSFREAQVIELDKYHEATFHNGDDIDYFSILLPEDGILTLHVRYVPRDISVESTFIAFDQIDERLKVYNPGDGESYEVHLSVCGDETLYFYMEEGYRATNNNTPFEFKISWTSFSEVDSTECRNNDEFNAYPIKCGQRLKGSISPLFDYRPSSDELEDVDYFTFKHNKNTRTTFDFVQVPSDLKIVANILDTSRNLIPGVYQASDEEGEGFLFDLTDKDIDPGEYVLSVQSRGYRQFNVVENYIFHVECESTSSVEKLEKSGITLSPMPFENQLRINQSGTVSPINHIEIYDLQGNCILKKAIESESEMIELKVNLNTGVYHILLYTADGIFVGQALRV